MRHLLKASAQASNAPTSEYTPDSEFIAVRESDERRFESFAR